MEAAPELTIWEAMKLEARSRLLAPKRLKGYKMDPDMKATLAGTAFVMLPTTAAIIFVLSASFAPWQARAVVAMVTPIWFTFSIRAARRRIEA